MRGQRGGRCLAVAAADRQNSGIGQQGTHALGEEFDFGNHRQATRQSLLHHGFRERDAGRNGDEFDPFKQGHEKRARQQLRRGDGGAQRGDVGRIRPAVGNPQASPLSRQPARHRQPGFAKAENEDGFALEHHFTFHGSQRIFRVDKPTSTSMMVMIQNRTTTLVSFQPPSS